MTRNIVIDIVTWFLIFSLFCEQEAGSGKIIFLKKKVRQATNQVYL